MIRSAVGKHRLWASVLAAAAGLALLVVACETPVPQEQRDLSDPSLSVTEGEAAGRLATGVGSNWISQEQADAITEELDAAGQELRRAIAAGEMTEREASGRHIRMEVGAFGRAIRMNVAAGEMTEYEGQAAFQAYLEFAGAGRERSRGNPLRTRLGAAVEEGWITRERAGTINEELIAVQRRLQANVEAGEMTREKAGGAYLRFELEAIATAVRERVAAGELTAEEGRAAMEGYRKLMSRNR